MQLIRPVEVKLHYKITTPMFLGGENQKTDGGQFRNASYKGALRFWWRALNWGAAFKDAGGQQKPSAPQNPSAHPEAALKDAALKLLHEREGKLFGLANGDDNSKQSCVQIHSKIQGATVKQAGNTLTAVGYLLGQGLFRFPEAILRPYLEGGTLTISLCFKPNTAEVDIQSVQQASIALGLFGGLGSRSRKGFGSLALQKIEREGHEDQTFTTEASIQRFIDSLDFSAPANAPLSALSQTARMDISTVSDGAMKALAQIAKDLQIYRGFGRSNPRTGQHEVNGQKALQSFKADHDAVQAASKGGTLQALPKRAVFGLPHNYFFSSTKTKLDINVEGEARRTSPLLVHIHALEDGKFIAIQTLLQSQFLPQGLGVEAKRDRAAAQNIPNTVVDYGVITRYMDGFSGKKTLRAAQA